MNSKKPFNVFPATPSISPTMRVTLLLYITSPTPFLLTPLTKNVTPNSTPLAFNNFRVITASNFAGRDFLPLQTSHFSAYLHCFYTYDITSLRICKVESVLLPDAPQASHSTVGMYHIIWRDPNIQMKNDSGAVGFSISTLSCQACLVRPSCQSKLSFNQRDLELVPDMDFRKNNTEPLLATIEFTPTFDQILKQVPISTHKFHTYSIAEARKTILSTVRLELAQLLNVKRMSPETLADLTRLIVKYYSSISPATSAALPYLPTRTAVLFSLSVALSLLTSCISFTLFCRQWTRLFAHPQHFFRGTSGRFLHIVEHSAHCFWYFLSVLVSNQVYGFTGSCKRSTSPS